MTFGRRYCWSNNKYDNCMYETQYQPAPRQYQELCPIANDKDNYSLSENTQPQTNIISKGFFQSEDQKDRKSTRLNSSH